MQLGTTADADARFKNYLLKTEAKTASLKAESQNAHKVKQAYDEGFASAQAVYKDMLNRMETAAKSH